MSTSVQISILAAGLLVILFSAWLVFKAFWPRKDPEERRRELISAQGRIIEGQVIDYHEGLVVYSWSWRGVEYEASQDLRSLAHLLPVPDNSIIGSVGVKFLPRDPSNSIVISESWNGFRVNIQDKG